MIWTRHVTHNVGEKYIHNRSRKTGKEERVRKKKEEEEERKEPCGQRIW
jgi:hypothetical protein